MESSDNKNNRLLTQAIIAISVCGILFFGYLAISNNLNTESDNPFEYNIDNFKKNNPDLLQYTEVGQIPLDFDKARAIAVGAYGKIYIAGENFVHVFSKEKNLLSTIAAESDIYTLAVDENEDIYLCMDTNVEVYDKSGTNKSSWKSLGNDAILTSIAVSEEFVFVADAGNHIVWKYDKSGNILLQIGKKNEVKDIPGFIIPTPYFDLSIDPDRFLWVVNPGRHSIENYTFEGEFRTSWGEFAMETHGFSGCCNPTYIAILDDGKFVTSEKGIPRVKVYNRLGELESVVAEPSLFEEFTEGLDLAVDSDGRIYLLDPDIKSVRIFEKNKTN